jgi:hypothetical protein
LPQPRTRAPAAGLHYNPLEERIPLVMKLKNSMLMMNSGYIV